jgi:MFS family permease
LFEGLGPEYKKLWTASTVSNLGDGVVLISGPLLAASLTRDPLLVSGVIFVLTLPWLLFSLVSGALVDRLDRRQVMAVADLFRSVVIWGLGLAVLLDLATLPLVYAAFFLIGLAETFFDNAAITMLPAIVPKTNLDRANGRLFGARIVANELSAPPLGGLLFAAAAAVPFLLSAGVYAAAAALVLMLRGKFRVERVEGAPATTLRTEIAEGVRWLWGHRLLRTLALALAVMNVTLASALAIMVLVAQERLGLGSVGYGVLMSAIAVGGIAGSLTAERITAWLGPGTAMRIGLGIEAATHLVIALTTEALAVGAILALFGLHAVVWSVISVSLRQRLVPERLLGRVNSAYMLFSAGSVSIGALLGGALARSFGLTAPFWFAFALVAVLAGLIWPVLNNSTIAAAHRV